MKHFEILWEKAGGGICGKQACEKYYRDALTWVLSWEDDLESIDIIKEELEE